MRLIITTLEHFSLLSLKKEKEIRLMRSPCYPHVSLVSTLEPVLNKSGMKFLPPKAILEAYVLVSYDH
jgi:hypothetical protein